MLVLRRPPVKAGAFSVLYFLFDLCYNENKKTEAVTVMEIKQGAETFFLQGERPEALLLIHGYTGTPAELRPLGERLNACGYTVLGPRLAGHGGSLADLAASRAEEWYASVEAAYERLAKNHASIYVAGLSLGGLLALKAAAKLPLKGGIYMSTPIFVPDRRLPFLWLLKYFIKYLPKRRRSYGEMDVYNLCNDRMPVAPLPGLFRLLKECKENYIRAIKSRALIIQASHDHTVLPVSGRYIYENLGSRKEDKILLSLEQSGHIVTLDKEREKVFAAVANFLQGTTAS